MVVLHARGDRSNVYAVSILRNSLVDVPRHGKRAINAAYAYGGVKLTARTVEQLLNVRINHVVDISLTGLTGLTDALGSVECTRPPPFRMTALTSPRAPAS